MRKLIAALIMMSAVTVYVIHVINVGNETEAVASNQTKTIMAIEGEEKKLQEAYPVDPASVMQIYNNLLEVAYSGEILDEEVPQYVEVVRLMYSQAFKTLNPVEEQTKDLMADIHYNQANDINSVASSVQTVYIVENENGEQMQAAVTVQHVTNKNSVQREYLLIKEKGQWRINGWQSVDDTKTEE